MVKLLSKTLLHSVLKYLKTLIDCIKIDGPIKDCIN